MQADGLLLLKKKLAAWIRAPATARVCRALTARENGMGTSYVEFDRPVDMSIFANATAASLHLTNVRSNIPAFCQPGCHDCHALISDGQHNGTWQSACGVSDPAACIPAIA